MLDPQSTETYKSITLTRDLRADILQKHAEKMRPVSLLSSKAFLRPATVFCAMMLIVIGAIAFQPQNNVYAGERKLDDAPQKVDTETVSFVGGSMRTTYLLDPEETTAPQTASECIPLHFSYRGSIYLAVTEGALLLPNENGQFLFAGQSGEVKRGSSAYWVLDNCQTSTPITAQITDPDGNALGTITVTYDATDNTRYIAVEMSES